MPDASKVFDNRTNSTIIVSTVHNYKQTNEDMTKANTLAGNSGSTSIHDKHSSTLGSEQMDGMYPSEQTNKQKPKGKCKPLDTFDILGGGVRKCPKIYWRNKGIVPMLTC